MSQSWGDLYERRKAIQRRFGRIHRLPVIRRVHQRLLADLKSGDAVLDVGAGGRRLPETLKKHGLDVQYESLDPDANRAHDYATLEEVGKTYRAVTCFEVLEHVPMENIPALLLGMARVLEPGGRLFVSTPNVYKPQEFLRDATHCTPLCYDQLAGIIEAAGLEVVAIFRANADPAVRRFVRRVLLGWLYRTLDLDYARQILVVARRRG